MEERRRRQHGRDGVARCGRPAGVAASLLVAAFLLGGCQFLGIGAKSGKIPARTMSVFHLGVGDCLNPPSKVQAQVSTLSVVPCQSPHTEQVYALLEDKAGDNYPGPTKLESFANAKCLQHFDAFVGIAYQESSLFYTYLLPSVRSWAEGDRTVSCIVTTTGLKLTSSAKGSKR